MFDKKALLKAIANEEALLSRLNTEREEVLSRLSTLKQKLAELETACAEPSPSCAVRTPNEKIALFRSLFRGREGPLPETLDEPRR